MYVKTRSKVKFFLHDNILDQKCEPMALHAADDY